jgi:hypothetical protein
VRTFQFVDRDAFPISRSPNDFVVFVSFEHGGVSRYAPQSPQRAERAGLVAHEGLGVDLQTIQ